jgi:hypothetical protein
MLFGQLQKIEIQGAPLGFMGLEAACLSRLRRKQLKKEEKTMVFFLLVLFYNNISGY